MVQIHSRGVREIENKQSRPLRITRLLHILDNLGLGQHCTGCYGRRNGLEETKCLILEAAPIAWEMHFQQGLFVTLAIASEVLQI